MVHWIHDKVALFLTTFDKRLYWIYNIQYSYITANDIVEKFFTLISPDFLYKTLREKQVYIPVSEYKTIISSIGFSSRLIETEIIITEWKDLDEFLVTAHGVLQGKFDPTTVDKDDLQQLKEEHGGDSMIKWQFELIKAVIIK